MMTGTVIVTESMYNFIDPSGDAIVRYMEAADGFHGTAMGCLQDRALREFNTFKEWLPDSIESILDIGSGLGGVDILLQRYTGARTINIIEGDGSANKKTGYNTYTEAWCDRSLSRSFIQANVAGNCVVNAYPPDSSLTIEADLVVSLKSWCHHYPVSVYAELVRRSLRGRRARVIVDIRWIQGRPNKGLQEMKENGFKWLATVHETPKCRRMVFRKNG